MDWKREDTITDKIKHILEFYPSLKYVLIEMTLNMTPFLYEAISKIFPMTVKGSLHKANRKIKK
jgi:hypothetical protein